MLMEISLISAKNVCVFFFFLVHLDNVSTDVAHTLTQSPDGQLRPPSTPQSAKATVFLATMMDVLFFLTALPNSQKKVASRYK